MGGSVIPVYRWFECDGLYMAIDQTSGGSLAELGLGHDLQAQVMHLMDAVLLADHDPLLQFLEAWGEQVFDWKPVSSTASSNVDEVEYIGDDPAASEDSSVAEIPLHQHTHLPRLTVSLSSLEGQKRVVYLAIPHDELIQMPTFPEQWHSLVALKRYTHQFDVVLQEKILRAREQEKLEPGAFVLLSASFSDSWALQLQPVEGGSSEPADAVLPMRAELNAENNAIRLCKPDIALSDDQQALLAVSDEQEILQTRVQPDSGAADSDQALARLMKIRFKAPVLINQLYSNSAWQSGNNVLIALPESLESAAVEIALIGSDLIFYGRIVALGKGFGVLLDNTTLTKISNQD